MAKMIDIENGYPIIDGVPIPVSLDRFIPPDLEEALRCYPSYLRFGGLKPLPKGSLNPLAKISEEQSLQIREQYAMGILTMEQIAAVFGVSFQNVSKIVHRERWPDSGGPVISGDLRHIACERDAKTGRFTREKAAGRLLDGRTWEEMPK